MFQDFKKNDLSCGNGQNGSFSHFSSLFFLLKLHLPNFLSQLTNLNGEAPIPLVTTPLSIIINAAERLNVFFCQDFR